MQQSSAVVEKQRFLTLDAMRGLAALTVVVRHYGQIFHGWEPESYLAVDVFFVLSGFVLAYNYDAKLSARMTPIAFMRLRAIRLFPLALAGALVGYFSQLVAAPTKLDAVQSIVSLALTAAAIPTPPIADPHILFPFNPAFWSLFFEFWVANVVFAFFWRQIQGARLIILIILSGFALVVFQRLYHYVDIGWQWSDFLAGFPRVLFSFFVGVWINRYYSRETSRRISVPSWAPLLVLLALLVFPASGQLGNILRLMAILFAFPALVFVGAGATHNAKSLYTAAGDLSYALYTIHFPIFVVLSWVAATRLGRGGGVQNIVLEALAILGVCALALALDLRFDRPLRRTLTRWTRRGPAVQVSA